MNSNQNERPAEEQLRFFGTITASVTHEINNVFSVINENSGLLSDWIKQARGGRALDPEKLSRISLTIQKHLARGQEIIRKMNRFAHSVDEPFREFELADAVENIVALSERFAYRKKIVLQTVLPKEPLSVKTSPFLVQQAVFNSIMFMLNLGNAVETIQVRVEPGKQTARIVLKGGTWNDREAAGPELATAALVVSELKGSLDPSPAKGEISISLPRNRGAAN